MTTIVPSGQWPAERCDGVTAYAEYGPVSQLAGGSVLALGVAVGIPLAFVTVLVPAGIYRTLGHSSQSSAAAEIFA